MKIYKYIYIYALERVTVYTEPMHSSQAVGWNRFLQYVNNMFNWWMFYGSLLVPTHGDCVDNFSTFISVRRNHRCDETLERERCTPSSRGLIWFWYVTHMSLGDECVAINRCCVEGFGFYDQRPTAVTIRSTNDLWRLHSVLGVGTALGTGM